MFPLMVLLSVVVVVISGGCTDDCSSTEPAYAGAASDESWRALLDARESAATDGDVAVFTAPTSGASLSVNGSPTFEWSSPLKVAMDRAIDPRLLLPRRHTNSWFDDVRELVMPSARAHLPPITSDIYLLEIDAPDRTCPVAGVTTELSFTLSSGDWEAVTAGGAGPRTARLLSAFVTENRVTEGAFIAAPLIFTIDQ